MASAPGKAAIRVDQRGNYDMSLKAELWSVSSLYSLCGRPAQPDDYYVKLGFGAAMCIRLLWQYHFLNSRHHHRLACEFSHSLTHRRKMPLANRGVGAITNSYGG